MSFKNEYFSAGYSNALPYNHPTQTVLLKPAFVFSLFSNIFEAGTKCFFTMPVTDERVDAYIAKAAPFAQPILSHLRQLIHQACPQVVETIKWGFASFDYNKRPLCSVASFKQHCVFGFWLGSHMQDKEQILETAKERHAMGNLGRIEKMSDLPADKTLIAYIQEAMELTDKGVKFPRKEAPATKEALVIPDLFAEALARNMVASEVFDKASYSFKKEYIEWIAEAKTDATKEKRVTTAIEWIAEGKHRNWKYMKK